MYCNLTKLLKNLKPYIYENVLLNQNIPIIVLYLIIIVLLIMAGIYFKNILQGNKNPNIILIFIVGLIIVLFFFYTPQIITDSIWGRLGNMQLTYQTHKKTKIKYLFNHTYYDGELMSYYIKNELLNPKKEYHNLFYTFKSYQYLPNKRLFNFSILTSSLAELLQKMVKHQNRTIIIGIIVSMRHQLNNHLDKGNYLKFSYYKVEPTASLLEICINHDTAVNNVKYNNYYTNKILHFMI